MKTTWTQYTHIRQPLNLQGSQNTHTPKYWAEMLAKSALILGVFLLVVVMVACGVGSLIKEIP